MKREEFIHIVYSELCSNVDNNRLNRIINAVDEYVKEQTQWIPISEKLPEKNMLCLVSVGKLNLTQIAMYSDLMGIIDHKIFYQGDVGYDSFKNITEYVKAWMPLPKAYKVESEIK